MKTLALLYRKQFIENRKTILLYLLIYFLISYLFLFQIEKVILRDIVIGEERGFAGDESYLIRSSDLHRVIERLLREVQPVIVTIWAISLCICVHWGIRHFNYSSQRTQYNTLPVSVFQKWAWIISYIFVLLPMFHLLMLWLGLQLSYPFNLKPETSALFISATQFFFELLHFEREDPELAFIYMHLPLFLMMFTLVAMQFNRMGFIKTIAGSLILTMVSTLFIAYLNYDYSAAYGNLGERESQALYPDLYRLYFAGIFVLFLAGLAVIGLRLKDKNY